MAGANKFAFFRCRSICTGGGGPESWPVPVPKSTFPAEDHQGCEDVGNLNAAPGPDLQSRWPVRK